MFVQICHQFITHPRLKISPCKRRKLYQKQIKMRFEAEVQFTCQMRDLITLHDSQRLSFLFLTCPEPLLHCTGCELWSYRTMSKWLKVNLIKHSAKTHPEGRHQTSTQFCMHSKCNKIIHTTTTNTSCNSVVMLLG